MWGQYNNNITEIMQLQCKRLLSFESSVQRLIALKPAVLLGSMPVKLLGAFGHDIENRQHIFTTTLLFSKISHFQLD